MRYTSAEAAKLLRKLNEDHAALIDRESKSNVFIAAIGEELEDVRPVYAYKEVQEGLKDLERKIRIVKHAINYFNLTTEVPGFGMTVDQILVYIPQLSARKRKLAGMAGKLPKERLSASGYGAKTIIEYRYANYEITDAEADLAAVTDELARAQTALDVVNNSETMEIELD